MSVEGFIVQVSYGIGNSIMKTPMLLALRRLYPKAIIDVWCCHTTGYETLLGLREHWYQPEPLFNIFKRSDDMGGHSIAIITEPRDDTFRRSAVAVKYIEHTKEKLDLFGDRHEVEVNMDLVRQLGYKGPTPATRIYIPCETQQKIDHMLFRHNFSKYKAVVAIHNGSLNTDFWSLKRWNEDKVLELICRLKKNNILPIIIGKKEDWTIPLDGITNYVGQFSIKETSALLARCSLLVSTDSGPAHLADAMGTPTITLFGPTYPVKNVPYNQGEFISASLKCQPCYWTDRMEKCKKSLCMEKITVDIVMDKILEKL
jgi:ADP-heptose:LPS heptosyltransferase